MIPICKPFLPPQDAYLKYLDGIWERNWLTNNGPLVQELENKLSHSLQIPHVNFVSNGTIALQIAIKALELSGQIITTPFSYVATTSSIVWEGCEPIFVDIDAATCNINPKLIESAITPHTSAILATHVFGNPCDVYNIEKIAKKHDLKVIYDAAHAFGVEVDGRSIFSFGDISTTSFHATKLFHTTEGGALFTTNEDIHKRIGRLRNFGHSGPDSFDGVGINGKNSEFHAAMGLVNLDYIERIIEERKFLSSLYDAGLAELQDYVCKPSENISPNGSYYPVLFKDERALLEIISVLNDNGVFGRRYFFPSLSKLDYLDRQFMQISEDVASRIYCLPLYNGLQESEVEYICELIQSILLS